jgi:3-deoxy-D-manno-octulosonate 8-phosphate phosphatase (KDO 8-P phosphatase)
MNINYLVMDVDGTLTDGKIYIGNSGEICKAFSIRDGYGICNMAIPKGIIPVVITGRKSEIVLNRCKELGIEHIYQGVSDKEQALKAVTSSLSEVAYIGDDINDIPCMNLVKKSGGIVGCPKDAAKEVLKLADYVSKFVGGNGAVRDFIEWILEKKIK